MWWWLLTFDAEDVAYMHLLSDFHSMIAVTLINFFFFVADVKCGLYEINKKQQESVCHTWTEISPKMFWDQTKEMLHQRGPGPGPLLTLVDAR